MRDIVDHRYRVEDKLASGGYGTVYRVTDLAVGRQVALKVLHRELAGDPNVVARFRREAAALAALRSPHTVTLYDVGTTDGTLYLVMELLRGESLQQVFDDTGPLPWRRMARVARGVCASLREAHAHGIVHRDLKPANIVIERHGLDVDVAKVLDFGIAKILETSELAQQNLTRHGQMIGTWDYMSPEQMVADAPCTAKTDVFSLGVVMYEMISGRRPYGEQPSPPAMLMALLTRPPAPLTGVPPELAATITASVAREAHDRPDMATFDAVLERALATPATDDDDEPTMVDTRHLRPRAARPGMRRDRSPVYTSGLAPTVPVSIPSPVPSVIVEPTVAFKGRAASPAALARGSDRVIDAEPAGASAFARTASPLALDATLALSAATPALEPVGAEPLLVTSSGTIAVQPRAASPVVASLVPASRPSSVNVRFTPAGPLPAVRARLATGTSPIANEVAPSCLPHTPAAQEAPPRGIAALHVLTIAACLFGFGFVVALAFTTL